MLLRTTDKFEAAESYIKVWLKDPTKKCFNCDTKYNYQDFMELGPCCDKPLIGDNLQAMKVHMRELETRKAQSMNVHSSTKDKSFRYALSIPADLYMFLDRYFRDRFDEPFIKDEKELNQFMKRFQKHFTVPEVV